ncbi:hypothetical protein IZY60_07310 [Lutibacter sp. B2]|nr:hypothetical protein [Lutibacter sp. B2]
MKGSDIAPSNMYGWLEKEKKDHLLTAQVTLEFAEILTCRNYLLIIA